MKQIPKETRLVGKKEKSPIACRKPGCDAIFSRSSNRDRHKKKSCSYSGEVFPKVKSRPVCVSCGSVFKRPYCLRRHVKFSCKKRTNASVPSKVEVEFSDSDPDDVIDSNEHTAIRTIVGGTMETIPGSPESFENFALEGLEKYFD